MSTPSPAPQTALKYEVDVLDHGRVELNLPYAAGARVTIIVIPEQQEPFPDLVAASTSSLAFWDNPLDDMHCRFYYTRVENWPPGTTHLQIKITFDQAINDGNADFPAGTHTYRYAVTLP